RIPSMSYRKRPRPVLPPALWEPDVHKPVTPQPSPQDPRSPRPPYATRFAFDFALPLRALFGIRPWCSVNGPNGKDELPYLIVAAEIRIICTLEKIPLHLRQPRSGGPALHFALCFAVRERIPYSRVSSSDCEPK